MLSTRLQNSLRIVLFLLVVLSATPGCADPAGWQEVYARAQQGHWFADANRLHPDILPTSDGRSFVAVWTPPGGLPDHWPEHWIVSLHGSRGFATDDLAIWHRLAADRHVGILCLQWWVATGDSPDAYYTPQQIYHEIDLALQKLGVLPGTVMLHGFSRGSANAYAVAALDAGRGHHYFALDVASSGGVSPDYPPTHDLVNGVFGPRPLAGTRWVTAAGGTDPHPDRDGIAAMRRTGTWLQEQGATVVAQIEDPSFGHGALVLNPANAQRLLDLFLTP